MAEDLNVFVNNVAQQPGSGKSYTATGTTLTFDAAPDAGTNNVSVVYRGLAEPTTRLEHPSGQPLAATTGTFSGAVSGTTGTFSSTLSVTGLFTPSAGIALGGAGSANHLDDYEEGSWTPSVSYGSGSSFTTITSPNVAVGAYRKIGSLLYISFYFYKNSSPIGGSGGGWRVNVPFAIQHGGSYGYPSIPAGYWTLNGTNYFNSIPTRLQANGSDFLDMYGAQGATAWSSGIYELAGHGLLMTT